MENILDGNGFPALHCIWHFGIAEVANILMKINRSDMSGVDGVGATLLIWA